MSVEEMDLYRRTINEIRFLLSSKERLGEANLPAEFTGFISDLLYDEKNQSKAFIYLVDELVQSTSNKGSQEILHRLELLNSVLTKVYEDALRYRESPNT